MECIPTHCATLRVSNSLTMTYSNPTPDLGAPVIPVASEADVRSNLIKRWILVKRLLLKVSTLTDAVAILDTAKTDLLSSTITLEDFEYEIYRASTLLHEYKINLYNTNQWDALIDIEV